LADDGETLAPSGGRVPIPDPTRLTTAQLDRAVASVRELMQAEIRVIVTRLDGGDTAVKLLREERLEIPKLIASEIAHEREVFTATIAGIKELMLEKFAALATLTDKLSLANATALTAALSAAEKAVGEQNRSSSLAITKSEQGMQEALKQLQTTFQTEIKGITALMATMQSRLDRGEGVDRQARDQVVVARDATQASQGGNANMIGICAVALAAVAIIVSVVLAIAPHAATVAALPH
jgi:hypothetical protein